MEQRVRDTSTRPRRDAYLELLVTKVTPAGAFFASMYPTGRSIRPSHRRFRKVLP